ncbi:MAG: methyltransferase [Roseivivax sp.]|nr:methyltransferase [Roseivivax sp.]
MRPGAFCGLAVCRLRAEPFADTALSRDAFLGGAAQLLQPLDGYRAGTDPVLLAAATPASPGQAVMDLGCGGGAALVLLGVRVPGLSLTGVEVQPAYADLARRNLALNGLEGLVAQADLTELPAELRARSFDHVMANPPYFEKARRTVALDAGREVALAGETPLDDWVAVAARRLRPGGTATFIQRAERLPDLLAAFCRHLGSVELLPLCGRLGRPPRLILMRGRKQGRAAFRFHAPLVLHRDDPTLPNGYNYTDAAERLMRQPNPLPFPAD